MDNLKYLINKVKKIIKDVYGNGEIKIYVDYNEQLSDEHIEEIIKSKNPSEKLEEILSDLADYYACDWGYYEVEKNIKDKLNEAERVLFDENSDIFLELIQDNICFYYSKSDLNRNLKVNIMIDCGNWKYDCTCDNILVGHTDEYGIIHDKSSMLWLAKTQNKEDEFRQACEDYIKNDELTKDYGKFVKSAIEELEEMTTILNTITFLVEISLLDYIKILEKRDGSVVLGKSTICGLFDPFTGGGSILGVELEKDVEIPIKQAVLTTDGLNQVGYDVDQVYGLIRECWKETIIKII